MSDLLAAVDAVEKIIAVWNKIQDRVQEQKAAEALAADLSDFGIESSRTTLQNDVRIAQRVARDPSTREDTKKDLERQFQRVDKLLRDIEPAIEDVVKNKKLGEMLKYFSASANRKLAERVEKYWAAFRVFDQAVMTADVAARSDPWLIQPGEMKAVGMAPAPVEVGDGISLGRVSYAAPHARESTIADVVWETLHSNDAAWDENDRDMRNLAAALSGALPQWHIPKLIGYEQNRTLKTMRLVFAHPEPSRALYTLSDVYEAAPAMPSLALRTRLCYHLALAVLHADRPRVNVVHKHIRPDNLLLALPASWQGSGPPRTLAIPPDWKHKGNAGGGGGTVDLYLSGWQNSRTTSQTTTYVGESAPYRVIYQHPQRHQPSDGAVVAAKYNIGHDIYSLGACMLELLTWKALVTFDSATETHYLSPGYLEAFKRKGFDASVDASEDADLADLYTRDAGNIQATLIDMAETLVPPSAGDRLARLVCRCLTCLDPVPMYGGSRFHDGDDKNKVSQAFSAEIFSDLNTMLSALEVAA
ncbi:hypothetical protein B0T26DRAFT_675043 [Lasiosphaeria miniovina]|uniref:Protein kinase domain-containing protein n=1 Tax=Lasiosphaeria miniovina TaxID=1954250 RepID=A0AA40AWV6_9PEZI|nr:uncharacterized protein B0T26DRAFT_675043 [Lasiosphaeria miniovina]KAK0723479.1 hypothetical protein B0T26DRAFT_675043 [Lasiosphaeria miniovina]